MTCWSLVYHWLPYSHLTSMRLQMYRGIIDSFVNASGLPEEAILDVRGNHDSFDVPVR